MTDRYVVFGNPVAHSLSPDLHNYFAKNYAQDLIYDRVLIPEGCFESIAKEQFNSGLKGCNITVPCKLDAYKFADTLSPYAKACGAVNTLKLQSDGQIFGDNTDGRGLCDDFDRIGIDLFDKRILIIGAGGAARGIILPIYERHPKSITVVNRNKDRALELKKIFDYLEVKEFSELTAEYDLIINATSASLNGLLPPLPDEVLKNSLAVYDLMYKKDGQTVFTLKAQSLGVKHCFDGLGMLLGQAALSFDLWRGIKPDLQKTYLYFAKRLGRNA